MTQGSLDLPEDPIDPAKLAAALDGMRDAESLAMWPQRLLEIVDISERLITRAWGARLSPREIAQALALEIAQNQGGRPVYLPNGDSVLAVLRARRIYRDSGPVSIDALAERENIGVQQAYKDLALIKALEKKRRQPPLF